MFIIMVYDVNQKRVGKVLKTGRKYLTWVQNSVLEGELAVSKYEKLKVELSRIIKRDEDSVIFYTFRRKVYTSREIMGLEKGKQEVII